MNGIEKFVRSMSGLAFWLLVVFLTLLAILFLLAALQIVKLPFKVY